MGAHNFTVAGPLIPSKWGIFAPFLYFGGKFSDKKTIFRQTKIARTIAPILALPLRRRRCYAAFSHTGMMF